MGMKKRAMDKGVKQSEGVLTPPRGDKNNTRPKPEIIIPGQTSRSAPVEPIVSDGYRDDVPSYGANRRDVKEYSEAEPLVQDGLQRTLQHAQRVAKVVEERNKKLGRVEFACPFCRRAGVNKSFSGKNEKAAEKACADHIKKEHPMQVKELQMSKAAKEAYKPKKRIVAPPLNPGDMVAPEHKRFIESVEIARREHGHIRERAISTRGGRRAGEFNANHFMMQTERSAISALGTLNDKAIDAVVRMAQNKGKRILYRAAVKAQRERAVLAHMA